MGVQVTPNLDFNNGSLKLGDLTQPFSAYENTFQSYDLQNYSWQNCPLTWEQFIKPWSMAGITVFTVDVEEETALTDTATKTSKIKKKEAAVIAEQHSKMAEKAINEAAAVTESYWDYIQFKLNFGENLAVSDTPQKLLTRGVAENFGVAERKVLRNVRKVPTELLNVADVMMRSAKFKLDFKEAAALFDETSRKLKKWFFEAVDADEVVPQKTILLAKSEEAEITDAFKRTALFRRDFAENAAVSDEVIKAMELLKKDNAALYDAFLQACGGVISNIAITEGDMSLDEFNEATQIAPGYTPFMDFKVGEYEYQDALVRIAINAIAAQTKPSVSNVIMHVDIPDTQDRGTANITNTAAPTRINFTKQFYIVPEVNVNLRGGNTGDGVVTPYITSMDKTGFEVQLVNDAGQLVTGLITWQATGY